MNIAHIILFKCTLLSSIQAVLCITKLCYRCNGLQEEFKSSQSDSAVSRQKVLWSITLEGVEIGVKYYQKTFLGGHADRICMVSCHPKNYNLQ
jgi:hypothetical protein